MNPWLLIGIAVAWALSCWYAYDSGETNQANRDKAHYAEQLDQAIKEHNDDAQIDMQAAFEWGKRNATARTRSDTVAASVNQDAHDNPPSPICVLAPATVELFNRAVQAANNIQDSPAGVPDPLPAAPGTSLWRRGNETGMGSGNSQPGRPVPPPAGRVR